MSLERAVLIHIPDISLNFAEVIGPLSPVKGDPLTVPPYVPTVQELAFTIVGR
jgi:hypothetical protein